MTSTIMQTQKGIYRFLMKIRLKPENNMTRLTDSKIRLLRVLLRAFEELAIRSKIYIKSKIN